jgi:alpha-ribazole phosphatase
LPGGNTATRRNCFLHNRIDLMEIYLIRHTAPNIEKGICYGQADIDIKSCFKEEADDIRKRLPKDIKYVYSSPLVRCSKLAEYLFPHTAVEYLPGLREINCGDWELKSWNDIDAAQLDAWMKNFMHVPYPNGENFFQLRQRVLEAISKISKENHPSVAIISHAGVMRCILAERFNMDIYEALNLQIDYGSVIRISDHAFYQP